MQGLPTPGRTLSGPKRGWAASDVLAPAAHARGLSTQHITGSSALPLYVYGVILLTTVFHFLPIAVTAWLAARLRPSAGQIVLAVVIVAVD